MNAGTWYVTLGPYTVAPDGLRWQTITSLSTYVRAEIRHPGETETLPGAMAAMANPVWLVLTS